MPDVSIPQVATFNPVAAGIKPVQSTGLGGMSLGDIVNMAATTQAYQKQKELMPYAIEAGKAESKRAQLEAEKAGVDLNQHYTNIARSTLGGYLSDPDFINGNSEHMARKIQDASDYLHKIGAEDKAGMTDKLIELSHSNPKQVYQIIKNGVMQAVGPATQYQSQQPQYMTNAAGQIIQVTPGTGAAAPLGEPGAMGGATPPRPAQGGAPGAPAAAGGMGINPPTMTAQFAGAGAQTAAQDWTNTYQASREAPQRIAIFQNIKKLVPEAYTGVGSEKKQFAANLAQSIGIPMNVLESSSTDELAKNTKLLQLAGGNTDAARGLAELANPNTKMTKEGILRVTNQLIGIENMNVARANYLGKFTQDPAKYQQASAQFNQLADPRIFQEMTPEDVAKLKASMSPQEQSDLTNKIRAAKQLGIIQ